VTAEQVFKFFRAYKFFYAGDYDFRKYGGNPPPAPPLIKQHDRQFYYRIAQKMSDPQIHALFTSGFFFNPRAHASDFVSPTAFSAALAFAGRHENGVELMKADLYALRKRLLPEDVLDWLYGSEGSSIPPVLGEVIGGELPPDLACVLLLIPQADLQYQWVTYWQAQPNFGLGAHPWIDRLQRLDQLLNMHRPMWRMTTHALAKDFWHSLDVTTLSPITHSDVSLF
jgi:hypothetical protein